MGVGELIGVKQGCPVSDRRVERGDMEADHRMRPRLAGCDNDFSLSLAAGVTTER